MSGHSRSYLAALAGAALPPATPFAVLSAWQSPPDELGHVAFLRSVTLWMLGVQSMLVIGLGLLSGWRLLDSGIADLAASLWLTCAVVFALPLARGLLLAREGRPAHRP